MKPSRKFRPAKLNQSLRARFAAGETLFTAWSAMTSPHLAGVIAATAYDCVTLDMQHGAHDVASIFACTEYVRRGRAHVIVRVPVGANDMVSRALDFGAEAIIAPMINSVADAVAFAKSAKYPPMGQRSWGAGRAMELNQVDNGTEFLLRQNTATMSFAMIETKEAIECLDAILDIDGIDGVFVGPSDLSIALNNGAAVDPLGPIVSAAAEDVAKRARAKGKVAAIFCVDETRAKGYKDQGFQLIALQIDSGMIARGASVALAAAKGV
jgi:4-hydroxy-2-oxoheptanedioate aldolase